MILGDFHMHSAFSTDSEAPMEAMAEAAIKAGLKTICFTDHYDMDYPFHEDVGENGFLFDVDQYTKKAEEIREQYADRLTVRIGIELGLQPHLAERCRAVTEKYPFDFVIGSVHLVEGEDPYYGKMFENRTEEEAYERMFLETLENIKNISNFDVLGHLDYGTRYGKDPKEHYSYKKFADIIDMILRELLERGKGMEVNTAGLRHELKMWNPHADIIKRYRELGGEIITIGADAHAPGYVAYGFRQTAELLKKCGFEYYTEFSGRKPIFQQLP